MDDGGPRPGSEDYWAEKRRRDNERRKELDAIRRVNHLGLKGKQLNCGCTWETVLWSSSGRWSDALKFWVEAERWEYERPGVPHHHHVVR